MNTGNTIQNSIETEKSNNNFLYISNNIQKNTIDEHLLEISEVLQRYGTEFNYKNPMKSMGLSNFQISVLNEKHGNNELSEMKKVSHFVKYLKKLFGILNILLILSGSISLTLYCIESGKDNLMLFFILIFIALVNAFIEFYQEYKTEEILKSFLKLIPSNCTVIREGQIIEILAKFLVPGDLILLQNGSKIPADIRIISMIEEIKVDNSSLTGESEPQERFLNANNIQPEHAQNLLFKGTMLVAGKGLGIVIRTGNNTMLGKIASLTDNEKKRETRLTIESEDFVKKLAFISCFITLFFFMYGVFKGFQISTNLVFTIGAFVSYVPEGLPVVVAILLLIAAKRMSRKNVLVKDLQGVETLGSITMLCSDKTGTLTRNKMALSGAWIGKVFMNVNDISKLADKNDSSVEKLLNCWTLCSNGRVEILEKKKKIFGDATEIGLLKFAAKHLDVEKLQQEKQRVFEIPFSSDKKWHLTINKDIDGFTIFLKGAPERVLEKCSFYIVQDQKIALDQSVRDEINRVFERYAQEGNRVLGFAMIKLEGEMYPKNYKFEKDPINFPIKDFVFLGLASLKDPPKKGVKTAVVSLRQSGIKVLMVTGDHPLTAKAIAKQVGIVSEIEFDQIIIHGEEIESLTEKEWLDVFSKEEIIFARTLPHQKLLIVKKAQEYGHIVAVSGDGVNDAPALKKADLGISMNKTGADVSKEAAGMILLDDNFSSIVNGVQEGRIIFANLKKSIRYNLTHTTPGAIPYILMVVIRTPIMISSLLILISDLCMELVPSISLAWEPSEADLMNYPPRKKVISPEDIRLQIEIEKSLPAHSKFWAKIKRKLFYQDIDILIDNDMLSWCYIEIGILEFFGGALAFLYQLYSAGIDITQLPGSVDCFDPNNKKICTFYNIFTKKKMSKTELISALQAGQTAFFLGTLICQGFVLFLVKHRTYYLFGSYLFRNKYSFLALLFNSFIACLITFLPIFHTILKTNTVTTAIFFPFLIGILLLFYETLRKCIVRNRICGSPPERITLHKELLELKSQVSFEYNELHEDKDEMI